MSWLIAHFRRSIAVSVRIATASTIVAVVMMTFVVRWSAAEDPANPSTTTLDSVRLQDPSIIESSGLAASNRRSGRFWTHNDSGDGPRLFAFDSMGRRTGECRLPTATSVDWEDMSSYLDGDVPRLVVADCGDNSAERDSIAVYFFDEPDPDQVSEIRSFTKMTLRYADGPRDCEAIAVDARRRELVLVSKSPLPYAGVYSVPLPEREKAAEASCSEVAARITTLAIPMLTAMDIDAETGDAWIGNYFTLFHFRCLDRRASIPEQLSGLPTHFDMPKLKQIEALAVDSEHHVWVTTEGSPAVLAEVPSATAAERFAKP